MISKIRPHSHQKSLSLPIFGSIIEEYVQWCQRTGYSIESIRSSLKHSKKIVRFFRRHGIKSTDDLSQTSFETAWNYFHKQETHIASSICRFQKFFAQTHKLAISPPSPRGLIESEIYSYQLYLTKVRGLSKNTTLSYGKRIFELLEYIDYKRRPVLNLKKIEGFICFKAEKLKSVSLKGVINALRNFLKYKYEKGFLSARLHLQVEIPRIYKLEKPPRALPWETVVKFLQSFNRNTRQGLRDYTILFLVATYGLRANEVASITLDDIDWKLKTLTIEQKKTNRQLILPLTDIVCKVIIKYLKKGRPNHHSFRELFLTERAPIRPIISNTVSNIFRHQIPRSGLDIPFKGAHCLRHSSAVNLLRSGVSLKAIGDLLGHADSRSTTGYLSLNLDDLRSVSLSVPKDILTPVRLSEKKYYYSQKGGLEKKDFTKYSFLQPTRECLLTKDLHSYIQLKKSLGQKFEGDASVLHSLDFFLRNNYPFLKDLTAEIFNQWCTTFSHVSPITKRQRMMSVRNFCLYRYRINSRIFVPDMLSFPKAGQRISPYIFSDVEIGRLMGATQHLISCGTPIGPQTFRITLILLYTTGLRKGELLNLKLKDYNLNEKTLYIRDTKFKKSRIIPLEPSVNSELIKFLTLRDKLCFPMDMDSPMLCRRQKRLGFKSYSPRRINAIFSSLCAGLRIFTSKGKTPRIHDLRHSFAINALLKWYNAGEDVQVKLPLLATYMGHVSINSTFYYLSFVDNLGIAASKRFEEKFGKIITTDGQIKQQ